MRCLLPLLVLLAAPAMAQDDAPRTWRGSETPAYTVERELADGLEIRSYPSMIMAAVTVPGDRDRASGSAFQILAGYIFGANGTGQTIAMTSPVLSKPSTMIQYDGDPVPAGSTPEASDLWTQAFILPSEYALEDLPAPRDDSIRIFRTRPYRVATAAFLGRGTPSQYAQARQILASTLAEQGIAHAPTPEYAGYDAPWVDPSLKRHEVHYRLKD